jgi:O-antigen ligase
MLTSIINFLPLTLYLIGMTVMVFLSLRGKINFSLPFLVFLFPLQNVIERLKPFPLGKDYIDIILIAMVLGWIFKSVAEKRKIFESTPFNKLLFIMSIFTFISLWIGSSYLNYSSLVNLGDVRLQNWKNYMLFPLIFFIIVNNIRNVKEIKWLILAMILSMFVMDYYTINQIRWTSGLISRDKLHGTFVWLGPNELGAFFATYTFVLLGIYLFEKLVIKKAIIGLVLILNLFCVLFLYSRGAYIGIIAGLITLTFLKNRKLLIPLIVILIFWQSLLPFTVIERIKETHTEEGVLDDSSASRINLWKKGMEIFSQNPVVGIGFNTINFLDLGDGFSDTHNIYVKILAEQGIVGFLIFILLFRLALKSGWRLYKNSKDLFLKGLGLGFTLCVIAIMTTNIFGDRWTHFQLGAYFWVFLALVVRGNKIVKNQ